MYDFRVIPKAHDATVFDVGGEKIFWPERSIFHLPSVLYVTSQTVNKDNAEYFAVVSTACMQWMIGEETRAFWDFEGTEVARKRVGTNSTSGTSEV